MDIVPAGVHHGHVLARVVFRPNVTRIGKPGLLLDGQCVHVRPDQDRWTGPILHHRDDSIALPLGIGVFADVLGHVKPERAQLLGQQRRCFFFVV